MRRTHPTAQKWMTVHVVRARSRRGLDPLLGRGALEPVPLPLPRIRRQSHAALPALVDACPVDGSSLRIQRRERSKQRKALVFLAAQRREYQRLLLPRGQTLADRRAEHGMRAELEERRMAGIEQRRDRIGEANRAAHILEPVRRAERLAVRPRAAHRGDDRNRARARTHCLERARECVANGVHARAVKRDVEREHAREHLLTLQPLEECLDRRCPAGHGARHRAVHSRQVDLPVIVAQHRLDLVCRESDGEDFSGMRFRLQPAPMVRHQHGILERQRAGDVRGRHLAGAVSHHGIRQNAPGLPDLRQRHLNGEVRHLREIGLEDSRRRLVAGQLVDQTP